MGYDYRVARYQAPNPAKDFKGVERKLKAALEQAEQALKEAEELKREGLKELRAELEKMQADYEGSTKKYPGISNSRSAVERAYQRAYDVVTEETWMQNVEAGHYSGSWGDVKEDLDSYKADYLDPARDALEELHEALETWKETYDKEERW